MAKVQNLYKTKKRTRLEEYIRLFVSESKQSKSYKDTFLNVGNHLLDFEKKQGIRLYTDNVTEQVATDFIHYLKSDARNKTSQGKPLMANTVYTIWSKLGYMLRRASRDGYPVNFSFENAGCEPEETHAVYLTMEELGRINGLSHLPAKLAVVRDRFLLGCFTALRYSDYATLTRRNIAGGNIELKTRKTGTKVVIPIHPVVREILKRNGGNFPELTVSLHTFGVRLREICRLAGIHSYVLYERTVGMKVVRKRVKKYTMVTSHTARRTSATNMYLSGIPTFRIMLITGHKTEESFFRYIRINRAENAKILAEHPFFK
jgi:integrase